MALEIDLLKGKREGISFRCYSLIGFILSQADKAKHVGKRADEEIHSAASLILRQTPRAAGGCA